MGTRVFRAVLAPKNCFGTEEMDTRETGALHAQYWLWRASQPRTFEGSCLSPMSGVGSIAPWEGGTLHSELSRIRSARLRSEGPPESKRSFWGTSSDSPASKRSKAQISPGFRHGLGGCKQSPQTRESAWVGPPDFPMLALRTGRGPGGRTSRPERQRRAHALPAKGAVGSLRRGPLPERGARCRGRLPRLCKGGRRQEGSCLRLPFRGRNGCEHSSA